VRGTWPVFSLLDFEDDISKIGVVPAKYG